MHKISANKGYFFTVFITGAAVLIIEVAAVRILSPIYGSSLYVLSSVLTTILTALSLGYWFGGKWSDKKQSVSTLYSIIATSGLSVLVLLLSSQLLLPIAGTFFSPKIGPLLLSFGLFFVPTFLLGVVSPYIIKLQSLATSTENIGTVVGGTFFWGTFGSITGSLATGFLLIPGIGVSRTLILAGTTLVAFGVLMPLLTSQPLHNKKAFVFLVSGFILVALLITLDNKKDNDYVYSKDGIYSSIRIKDLVLNNKPTRLLFRDTNYSSAIYLDSKELVFDYTKFVLLYENLIPNAKNALILGGGAYTIPRTLTHHDPELLIDVVDIEPELFKLAQKYFDLEDISRIRNYQLDARVFLKQHENKYDFIFSDLFGTDLGVPFHLNTKEFYQLAASNLTQEGVFFLNVVGIPKTNRPSLVGSITKTLNSAFSTVKAYSTEQDKTEFQNVIFIARNNNKPIDVSAWELAKISSNISELHFDKDLLDPEILLTDDYSPVEYLANKQH